MGIQRGKEKWNFEREVLEGKVKRMMLASSTSIASYSLMLLSPSFPTKSYEKEKNKRIDKGLAPWP